MREYKKYVIWNMDCDDSLNIDVQTANEVVAEIKKHRLHTYVIYQKDVLGCYEEILSVVDGSTVFQNKYWQTPKTFRKLGIEIVDLADEGAVSSVYFHDTQIRELAKVHQRPSEGSSKIGEAGVWVLFKPQNFDRFIHGYEAVHKKNLNCSS